MRLDVLPADSRPPLASTFVKEFTMRLVSTCFAVLLPYVAAVAPLLADEANVLKYCDDQPDGMKSLGGSGELIRFEAPRDGQTVAGIRIHGSRYGLPQPPEEDFLIFFLSADESEIIAARMAPYSLFSRGDNESVEVKFQQPVAVPHTFWIALDFRAHQRKGVYVSFDTSTEGKHSRVGLPGVKSKEVDFGGDWMVQVLLGDAAAAGGPPARQAAAIAAIEKLGGKVHFDQHNAERPPIAVSFFENPTVVDADLKSLDDLTSLLEVTLDATQVTDAGLSHLKTLPNLGSLSLTRTRVTDDGLAHLAGLSRMEILGLHGTNVTDKGLVHLKGLTRLNMLSLDNTRITDAGLEQLKGLANLCTLNLDGTKVTDAGLAHLSALTSLRDLRLRETEITDAALAHLKGLAHLNTLVLNSTRVTDAGLAHLKEIDSLRSLWLADTSITDAGLVHLQGLTGLQSLVLGRHVTDAGVTKLQAALPECKIHR
jgi:hypothetical protein